MKRFATGLAAILFVLGAVAVSRALRLKPPVLAAPAAAPMAIDADAVAQHLAQAVRFQTVSFGSSAGNGAQEAARNAQLEAMRTWLERTYPNFHRVASREVVGESLLFTWKGRDAAAPPVLLMAHMDVVPVVAGTEGDWTHAPFAGDVADGFVWGRGALDDKGSLVCLLEAAERLAAAGMQPARTIAFAFGQDEEVGGNQGNGAMAALLAQRGARFAWVLDEGGTIFTQPLPGGNQPAVEVAVGEKGYLSLRLTAHGEGGHSSLPSRNLAIAHLATAITAVLDHPFSASLNAVEREQFADLAPYAPFRQRLLLANLWFSTPLVERALSRTAGGAAALRTSIAPTLLEAGVKDNVIPPTATAVVNFRLQPGDTIAGVVAHVRQAVRDANVEVTPLTETQSEPSPLADTHGAAYRYLAQTLAATYGLPVVPEVMTGATDSRHYLPLAGTVLRLTPFPFAPADLKRIHGTDERVAVAALGSAVGFYMRLMQGLDR